MTRWRNTTCLKAVTANMCCLLACSTGSRAGIVRVPEDYPTFRQGLAYTTPGDTLLVGLGWYTEPGGPAYIQPGVTVIGSGWDLAMPLQGTRLSQIELFFLAGAAAASVENLWILDRRVSSDNSLGTVRRCFLGSHWVYGGVWPDGYLVYSRGGITLEECFVRLAIDPEPGVYFYALGGTLTVRNCVMAIQGAEQLLYARNIGPYPLTGVCLRNNTFYSDGSLGLQVVGSPPIEGPVEIVNNICQTGHANAVVLSCVNGAIVRVQYNAFFPYVGSSCGALDATNLTADPLMCNPHYYEPFPERRDFALQYGSPCVGAGEGGTTIGALEVVCGIPAGVGENGNAPQREIAIDVSPHPLVLGSRISLTLRDSGPGVLRVLDSAGRVVSVHAIEAGRSKAVLEAKDGLWGAISPGIYYLEMTQGAERAVRKCVRLP